MSKAPDGRWPLPTHPTAPPTQHPAPGWQQTAAPVTTWWRIRQSWWLLLPLVGCSCLGGTGLLYLGLRTRRPAWWIPGLVYLLLGIAAFAVIGETGKESTLSDVAVWVLLLVWLANVMHACLINGAWLRWLAERRHRSTAPATTWLPGSYPAGPHLPGSDPYQSGPGQFGPHQVGSGQFGPGQSGANPAPPPTVAGEPYRPGPVATPVRQPPLTGQPASTPGPVAATVDVNQVEFDQLSALPGFDALRARHVLAERRVRLGFGSMAEFAAVASLAPHEYARLRNLLTCGPPAQSPPGQSHPGPPPDPTADPHPGPGSYPGSEPYPGAPPAGRVLDV